MGYALDHLSPADLENIARQLFKVKSEEREAGELHGLCPIHGEQNQSFSYNYKKDAYHCLSCGAKGDIIDLWSRVKGYPDQKEGFKAFLKLYGIETANASGTAGASAAGPKEKKEPAPVIDAAVLEKMPPLPDSWIARLGKERGWTTEVIEALGLRLQTHYLDAKTGEVKKIHGPPTRIVFPVRDDQGRLINLRCYKPKAKVNKVTSWGKGFGYSQLYPAGASLKPDLPVVLVEGEPDTTCALSFKINAITQTAKRAKWPKEHTRYFKGRDVIIAYDADQAGVKHGKNAAASLAPVARSVRLIEWPDFMGKTAAGEWPDKNGQDLTDFFTTHKKTIEDWHELIGKAREYTQELSDDDEPVSSLEFFRYNKKSNRWSFKPRLLANRILQDIPLMYDPKTGLLYKWGGKHWEEYFEDLVKKRCLQYLDEDSTSARSNDAASQAFLLSTIPHGREVNDNQDLVCIANGMIDLKSLDLHRHQKDYYATYQLDVNFEPDSEKKCDRWLRYLEQTVQTPAPIQQLQEFAGYCLTKDTKYGKALFLIGPGSDGKSLFLKILRHMSGPRNCSAVSFRDIEDQFYRSALYGKLLNISTEVGSKALESMYFKAIVTGDPISAAFKNRDPFEFLPTCKLAFAANKLPRVLDNSDGFFRRVLPVSFKKQFKGREDDKSLQAKLEAEISEIFVWSLIGLHRLWQQSGFTECEETNDLLMGYKRLNNPVLCFVEDECTLGEGDGFDEEKENIWKKYKKYCTAKNYTQYHYQNFFRELKTAVSSLRDYRPNKDGKRPPSIRGLKLNNPVGEGDDE